MLPCFLSNSPSCASEQGSVAGYQTSCRPELQLPLETMAVNADFEQVITETTGASRGNCQCRSAIPLQRWVSMLSRTPSISGSRFVHQLSLSYHAAVDPATLPLPGQFAFSAPALNRACGFKCWPTTLRTLRRMLLSPLSACCFPSRASWLAPTGGSLATRWS